MGLDFGLKGIVISFLHVLQVVWCILLVGLYGPDLSPNLSTITSSLSSEELTSGFTSNLSFICLSELVLAERLLVSLKSLLVLLAVNPSSSFCSWKHSRQ